jgi:hypothetical protein
VNPQEVASLFTSQVAAALQFEMEEVFAMTSEGLRGRLLMLHHAKAQGFAPHNADKLIMFLNLELRERAAGRVIDLKSEQPMVAEQARPQAPKLLVPPVKIAASEAGAIKQAPAFSSCAATLGASGGHALSSKVVALSPSLQPQKSTGSSGSGATTRSDSGSQGLRDRPWNRKKKSAQSEGFTIGQDGRMEVCFITSSTSNKRKPAKKKPPADGDDDQAPKPVRRQGLYWLPPCFSRHRTPPQHAQMQQLLPSRMRAHAGTRARQVAPEVSLSLSLSLSLWRIDGWTLMDACMCATSCASSTWKTCGQSVASDMRAI